MEIIAHFAKFVGDKMVTQSDVREFGKVIDGRRILIPPIQRDYAWDISGATGISPSNYGMILSNFTKMEQRNITTWESLKLG